MALLKKEHYVVGVLSVLFSVVCSGYACGEGIDTRTRVTKGTLEYGLLGGFWKGNNIFDNAPSSNRRAIYILPQIGQVLTDEIGSGVVAGNVELLLEPMAAHYYEPFSASAFGGSLVLKYNFLSFGRWMPFWDGGAGMLWTDLAPRIPEQSTQFNFILQTGPGVSFFVSDQWAITAGFRFHHISNSGIGNRNIGLNAWLFNLGVSFFSP
ncbi:MAG: acyloxyacyl hydrolase [Nitrospirota bacterium]|nr:acyloxyacyl hydrolase [Nitrospirota bacterium]MDH5586170.1 acyloxyacyl hydrolase [Nitrospirota bacterium]MDH5774292.1 acyloxyacyl hydrolase [Nitrospirota bacterium]